MTRRPSFGPWFKLYADVVERKGHYSDRQFRAFVEILAWGVRTSPRGTLPKRRAVEARIGVDEVAFMFEEGDLTEAPDGSVLIEGWDVYQSGVLSTDRKKPLVDSGAERVDNSSRTVPEPFMNKVEHGSLPLLSTSSTTEEENGVYPVDGGDRDALDRYFELTNSRPWGKGAGRWLAELQDTHGTVHVVAALEVEAKAKLDPTLLTRVAARLERQKDRVERAAERAKARPVPPPEPERPAPTPEEIAAGRAAWEALRRPRTGRGGAMQPIAAVLPSRQNGSALTSPAAADRSASDPAAEAVEANSFAPASGPPPRAAVQTDRADGQLGTKE